MKTFGVGADGVVMAYLALSIQFRRSSIATRVKSSIQGTKITRQGTIGRAIRLRKAVSKNPVIVFGTSHGKHIFYIFNW
jgi:hypothetical protein